MERNSFRSRFFGLRLSIFLALMVAVAMTGVPNGQSESLPRVREPPLNARSGAEAETSTARGEEPTVRSWSAQVLERKLRPSDLDPRVEALFGERFGGVWASHLPGSEAAIYGVRDPRPDDEAALRALRPGAARYLRIAPVKYSLQQLAGFKAALSRASDGLTPPFSTLAIGIEPQSNSVLLIVDVDHPALDRLRSVVPPDALQIRIEAGQSKLL